MHMAEWCKTPCVDVWVCVYICLLSLTIPQRQADSRLRLLPMIASNATQFLRKAQEGLSLVTRRGLGGLLLRVSQLGLTSLQEAWHIGWSLYPPEALSSVPPIPFHCTT